MSEVKKKLRVTDKKVDPQSKRGIRAVLTDESGDHDKMIYPMFSSEEENFYQDLKKLKKDFIPAVEGYVNGGGRRYALCEVEDSDLLSEIREKISLKVAIEMMKDLADAMEETHEEGFAFNGLSARDILVNEDGLILPPPAYPANDREISRDFAAVGGILYELLTGVEYRPGMSITPDTIPETIPYGAKRVICNATSSDTSRHFSSAKELIRAFDSRKVDARRNEPVPAHQNQVKAVKEKKMDENVVETEKEKNYSQKEQKSASRKGLFFGLAGAGVVVVIVAVFLLIKMIGGGNLGTTYDDYIQSAALAVSEGRYSEVESFTAPAMEKKPERLAAYYYQALSYYKAEDYQGTVDFVEAKIMGSKFELEENEQDMQKNIYYVLGNSYFMLQDYENAYKKLSSAQAKGYDPAAVGEMLALSSVRMENQAALDAVMTAETMGDAGSAYAEGVSLYTSGDFAAAAVKFGEVASYLEAGSEIGEFCTVRAVECYIQASDFESAINACDNLLVNASDSLKCKLTLKKAVAEMSLAKSTNDVEMYKNAIACFEDVVTLGYQVNMAKYEIGECYLWIGDRESAKTILDEVAASGDETYASKATSLMELNGLTETTAETTETTEE